MVILGHQFEKTGLNAPLQVIQTLHMPLFFMIAGYFISDTAPLKAFSVKRAKRLLVPYIATCLIVAVLCSIVILFKDQSIDLAGREFIKRLWITFYGSGSGHGSMIAGYGSKSEIGMMWYLIALFWSSVVVKAVCKNRMAGFIAVLISAVAIGTTGVYGWIPFSIQNGLASVMWVWLGYHVKKKRLLSEVLKFIRSPWLLLIMVSWILSAIYGCIHLYGNYYKLGIVDVVGAAAGSLIVFGICNLIGEKSGRLKKVLSWIGVNSMLIYCLHFLEHNVFPISSIVKRTGIKEPIFIALISWMGVILITNVGAFMIGKMRTVRKKYG